MKTKCPKCETVQDVPDVYNGKSVDCTSCKADFTVTEHRPVIKSALPKPETVAAVKLPSSFLIDNVGAVGAFFAILGIVFAIADESANGTFFCILWLFLCFILIGLGRIIDAINANTNSKYK